MRPQITLTDDDQSAIEEVVELVGGLPLALILAAACVDVLSVDEIVLAHQQSDKKLLLILTDGKTVKTPTPLITGGDGVLTFWLLN